MMLAALAVLAGLASQPAACSPTFVSDLRAKDQALLDAITSGNRTLWDNALAPEAVYVDENGTIMPRAEYLKQLDPLPPGISGTLAITDYQIRCDGDVALVIHKDDEHEDYHGIALHANYLMTETWVRRSAQWKLAMVHAYVVAVDPPPITFPPSKLDEYVGRYRAAPGLV